MPDSTGNNRRNSGSMSRLTAIILIVVVVLVAVAAFPAVKLIRSELDRFECNEALTAAQRDLRIAYLSDREMTLESARSEVIRAMLGMDDLCPGGGDVYIDDNLHADDTDDIPYELVCGLHEKDTARRTRLNANHVLEQVREQVEYYQTRGTTYPTSVTVRLNGEDLVCYLVDVETVLRRGTYSTSGYSGTVAYYGIAGYGTFTENQKAAKGTVSYFSFADPDHCANWDVLAGWSGDSYN